MVGEVPSGVHPPNSGTRLTPQGIRSTGGGHSHTGPGGRRPQCRTAKNIGGHFPGVRRLTGGVRAAAHGAQQPQGLPEITDRRAVPSE